MFKRSLLIAFALILFLSAGFSSLASDNNIPEDVQEAAVKYGDEYDISPELLLAIMYFESRYISTVDNGDCKGLMQINEPFHKERMERLGVTDLHDVDSNIHVGADYIAELYEKYGDYGIVLGLYHGEPKAIRNGRKGIYSKYTLLVLSKALELDDKEDF